MDWNTECGIFRKTRAFFSRKELKDIFFVYYEKEGSFLSHFKDFRFFVINQISFVATSMTVIEVNVYTSITVREAMIIIS